MKIEERIDLIKKEITTSRFLQMKGLGNEVPFYIFDYPPEKELLIRQEVKKIVNSCEKNGINVLEINIYEFCLDVIGKKISIDKALDFEKRHGSEKLFKKLRLLLKEELLVKEIESKLEDKDFNMVFLTGVGSAWPLIRAHGILNNLLVVKNTIPLIVFYPGEYSKYDINLFGKINDGNYYRAFRLIDYIGGN